MTHKALPENSPEKGELSEVQLSSPEVSELDPRVREAFDDSITEWPPSWFGAIQSDRPDTAARTEEILRAERICHCPTEDEDGCPHCGRAGPKQTTQEHRDRCHRASVGR